MVTPNWFAAVMGTGIVAVCLVGLPAPVPGRTALAVAVWLVAVALLVLLAAGTLRDLLSGHGLHRDPAVVPFYGAPAMALMTVGTGSLLVGHHVMGAGPALVLATGLWLAGTALGLLTTYAVPRLLLRRLPRTAATPAWLMPVVPPMVSAASGALLVPHVTAALRTPLLVASALCFAVTLVAAAPVGALVLRRLARGPALPAAAVPTLLIVLGPLGQSVTAAHHLGAAGPGLGGLAVAYAAPVWCLGAVWLVVAARAVARTARTGLPFSPAWWSFTFPVGTMVTGSATLARSTGLAALDVVAVLLGAVLAVAWAVVLVRSVPLLAALARGPVVPAGERSGVLSPARA